MATLKNATDTYVSEKDATKTFNGSTRLAVRGGASSNNNYAYIQFAISIPKGATITSAVLRFYQSEDWTGSKTLTVKRVTEAWTASKTNWNTKPAVSGTDGVAVTKATTSNAGTEWAFDVKAHVQVKVDNGAMWGWRVESNNDTRRFINSAQAGSKQPTLEVTYVTIPPAPSKLVPSGGLAVGVAKPVLGFDFSDDSGSRVLAAAQVQIHTANLFTAPLFDSGEVATSTPKLDLNTTGFTGASAGAVYYWRVRIKDSNGQWSPYSDVQTFTYQTQGTLAITSPTTTFTESTPPVTWTLTGRTQEAWQVVVLNAAGTVIADSGRQTSTVTTWRVPAGAIKDIDAAYTFVVFTWDNIKRIGTDNSPTYVRASTTATLTKSAGVEGVASLAAAQDTTGPGVAITWTRSTAPDYYVIQRDTTSVVVEPGDVALGGTAFKYIDYRAKPQYQSSWKVYAVVNGVTSSVSPTVTFTPKPQGIWLSDEVRRISVQLLGQDNGSWSMGETSGVYTPVGAIGSLVVTQALRGYEGSIAGLITEQGGKTVKQQEDIVWALKSTPGQTYVLTISDLAIPVVIANVRVTPRPEREISKDVSFDFYQVSDLPFVYN